MNARVTSGQWRVTREGCCVLRHPSLATRHAANAFTLVEVMVALLIFFMAVFTILGLMAVGGGVGLRLRKKGQLATAGQTRVRASGENVG